MCPRLGGLPALPSSSWAALYAMAPSRGGRAHAHSGTRLLGIFWTGEPHAHTAQWAHEAAPHGTHWGLLGVEGPLVCRPWHPLLLLGLSLGEVAGDAVSPCRSQGPGGAPRKSSGVPAPPSWELSRFPSLPLPPPSFRSSCRIGSVGSQLSQRTCSKYRCTFAVSTYAKVDPPSELHILKRQIVQSV